jgi:hypothetical protein
VGFTLYAIQKRNNLVQYILIACLTLSTQLLLTGCGGAGSVQDRAGSLTTPDTTSPVILSTTPLSGANSVATSSAVTVNFSKAINPTTVTTTTFNVSGMSGTITFGPDNRSAIFTPGTLPLAANTTYTINLSTEIKDLSGNNLVSDLNRTFTTAAVADNTAPAFDSSTPASGASGVAASSAITASFDEAINPATLTNATFKLTTGASAVAVTGTIAVSSDNRSAIFLPSTVLADGTIYKATLTTGIEDMSKNALASVSWNFTTAFVSPTSGNNLIINGGFAVSQRYGTSGVTASNLLYVIDRWFIGTGGVAPTATQTLATHPSGNGSYGYNLTVSGIAGNTAVEFNQRIEAKNSRHAAGQVVSISFWVLQTSGSSRSIVPRIYYETVTEDAFTTTTLLTGTSLSIPTGVWTKYTGQITLPSSANKGIQLNITGAGAIVAGQVVAIADVQLEVSPVATSFEQRTYGEELALSQRYYENLGILYGVKAASAYSRILFQFKVDKRTTGGVIEYTDLVGNVSKTSTFSASDVRTDNRTLVAVANDTGKAVLVVTNNTDTDVAFSLGKITVDTEL